MTLANIDKSMEQEEISCIPARNAILYNHFSEQFGNNFNLKINTFNLEILIVLFYRNVGNCAHKQEYLMWYFYIVIEKNYRQLDYSINIPILQYSNLIDCYAVKINELELNI